MPRTARLIASALAVAALLTACSEEPAVIGARLGKIEHRRKIAGGRAGHEPRRYEVNRDS